MNKSNVLKVFIGYDPRQPVAYHALCHSILEKSSRPVAFVPLVLETLPLKRQGLTPFTFSRFLVPYLCDYQGQALFLDIDMIVNDDIAKLFELFNHDYAVQVAKNKMAFEWASLILFNCEKCTMLTPEFIETANGLHAMQFVEPELIGGLPEKWNHLVGYDVDSEASLYHYTQGIPIFEETKDSPHAADCHSVVERALHSESWQTLMGKSVHSICVNGKLLPKFLFNIYEASVQIKPEFEKSVSKLLEEGDDRDNA